MSSPVSIGAVVIRYQKDVKIPLTFNVGVDCAGEVLYADLYLIGVGWVKNVNAIRPTLANPTPSGLVYGGAKGEEKTIILDFTDVPEGSNYSVVIRTYETGLINKAPAAVLSADGYTMNDRQDYPINLVLSNATSSQVQLDWDAPALGGATEYAIMRGTDILALSEVEEIDSTLITYTDDNLGGGLTASTLYYYAVVAISEDGIRSIVSNIENITTLA